MPQFMGEGAEVNPSRYIVRMYRDSGDHRIRPLKQKAQFVYEFQLKQGCCNETCMHPNTHWFAEKSVIHPSESVDYLNPPSYTNRKNHEILLDVVKLVTPVGCADVCFS